MKLVRNAASNFKTSWLNAVCKVTCFEQQHIHNDIHMQVGCAD
eukprot:SAG31_NODE_523_length_14545_cov_4.805067_9_plen_43_part_00